jgi:hypothetical protein
MVAENSCSDKAFDLAILKRFKASAHLIIEANAEAAALYEKARKVLLAPPLCVLTSLKDSSHAVELAHAQLAVPRVTELGCKCRRTTSPRISSAKGHRTLRSKAFKTVLKDMISGLRLSRPCMGFRVAIAFSHACPLAAQLARALQAKVSKVSKVSCVFK